MMMMMMMQTITVITANAIRSQSFRGIPVCANGYTTDIDRYAKRGNITFCHRLSVILVC